MKKSFFIISHLFSTRVDNIQFNMHISITLKHTQTVKVHTYIHYICRGRNCDPVGLAILPVETAMHACIHTYIHTYIHSYINTYIPTFLHTYKHTYIHTYIHTNTHTH